MREGGIVTGRPEAIAVVSTIAVFLAGVGVGAILNGIAHTAEIAALRATIARLRAAADRVGPEPRRPVPEAHIYDRGREAHITAAAVHRRGDPTT